MRGPVHRQMRNVAASCALAMIAGVVPATSAQAVRDTAAAQVTVHRARLAQVGNYVPTADQSLYLGRAATSLAQPMRDWIEARADKAHGKWRGISRPALARETAARFPHASPEQKFKIHMILLQVMMGDIADALQQMVERTEASDRQFTRLIVAMLDRVRAARAIVMRAFGRTRPPRSYSGANPGQAARAQDRASDYSKYVQINVQLMNELQQTERELVDALQSMQRQQNELWETVRGMRERNAQTTDRITRER